MVPAAGLAVEPLARERARGAARVLADAFVDDPGWIAVGPGRRRARWRFAYRTCLGAVRVALRWGGPSWCVVEGGEPVAVLTTFAPGRWPPPELGLIGFQSPGALLAGPPTIARSLLASRRLGAGHPVHDHVFVWMLGVSPARQRSGLGGRLLREAFAVAGRAGVPTFLDTANPANLPYYHSHGFDVTGETTLARGAPAWFMERRRRADN